MTLPTVHMHSDGMIRILYEEWHIPWINMILCHFQMMHDFVLPLIFQ